MTKTSQRSIIIYLGIINALTPFTIDLYLPAFADIAQDLNTNVARVSLSVATYFIGYAIGQLLYGPLLDRFGRKPPIYVGLSLYLLATIGCMSAQSIESLLVFRFISALGGSAASVAATAMVRDYFEPKDGARVFSMLMLVLSASPLFAPTIGGWMSAQFGWRSVFAFLTVMAVVDFFIVAFGLPPKYVGNKEHKLNPKALLQGFVDIFKVPVFRTYAIAGAFSFSSLFVYLTGSPAIFIEGFGLSKQQYSAIFAGLAVAMIGGGQINNFLLTRSQSAIIFRRALIAQMIFAAIFLALVLTVKLDLASTIAFLFLLLLTVGIGFPNSNALALGPFSSNAGSAAALIGFIQMGFGALLASLVGLMNMSGTMPTAVVMCSSSILAFGLLLVSKNRD